MKTIIMDTMMTANEVTTTITIMVVNHKTGKGPQAVALTMDIIEIMTVNV